MNNDKLTFLPSGVFWVAIALAGLLAVLFSGKTLSVLAVVAIIVGAFIYGALFKLTIKGIDVIHKRLQQRRKEP